MSKTSSESIRHELSGPTMGTHWSASVVAPPAADLGLAQAALQAAVEAVDAAMSNWRDGSDLCRLNAAPVGTWVALPADLIAVLDTAARIGAASRGAFDIAVGGLVSAWGFGPPARRFDLDAVRALTGHPLPPERQRFETARGRARRLEPVSLDLCGIAKGFAADRMATALRDLGLGDHLVGIDGELVASGARPDGSPWRVAVETPGAMPGAAGLLEIADLAVATSGSYRNQLRVGDERVSHVMDPRSARPAQSRLAAVSVLAERCIEADAWATALMVAGPVAGPAMAAEQALDALFQIETSDGLRPVGIGRFEDDAVQVENER
jgi:FAD:protein FMN transferase